MKGDTIAYEFSDYRTGRISPVDNLLGNSYHKNIFLLAYSITDLTP